MTLWISIHLPQQTTSQTLKAVATALLQYTPELAVFDAYSVLLNVGASLSLYKGPRKLHRHVRSCLQRLNVSARVGMAPTAMGAWLMARQSQTRQRRMLRKATLVRRLDALHVRHFPVATDYQDWLDAIGCTTLKQLNQLPRTGLRERTSLQVIAYLDAAYGKTDLHLHWYRAADTFHASCILDFHTTHTHALLAASQGLIEQLCGWLQARRQTASSMQFSLHHEKGRHACPPSRIILGLSTPSRYSGDFLRLLKERLQHERLHAPVIAIDLHQVHSQAECEPSGDLFPDRTQRRHQEGQLLDLLCARLGYDNILQPRSIASHLPEHANKWIPSRTESGPESTASRPGHDPCTDEPVLTGPSLSSNKKIAQFMAIQPPFWILDHPLQLDTHNERPLYRGRTLQLIQGPDRIESGWWINGQQEQRDYFVACDDQHYRYWIYRQRGSDSLSWYLHGLFA